MKGSPPLPPQWTGGASIMWDCRTVGRVSVSPCHTLLSSLSSKRLHHSQPVPTGKLLSPVCNVLKIIQYVRTIHYWALLASHLFA